jgi:hypothetical protein
MFSESGAAGGDYKRVGIERVNGVRNPISNCHTINGSGGEAAGARKRTG